MIGFKYSVVFTQLLLSLVSAAPVTTEVAAEAAAQNQENSIFAQTEKVETTAETDMAAAEFDNNLELKQNLSHHGHHGHSNCGGNCCNECGGCPAESTCSCPSPPCPCDILKAVPCPCDILKAVPCPCDLLKGACVCGKKAHCNECGQEQCVCHEKPKHHCNECGQEQCGCPKPPCVKPCFKPCCIKPPCPCEVGKCICAHKPECHKCGQQDCCC